MPTSDRNYLSAYYYRNIYDRLVHNSRFDVPFRDFLAQLFEFFKKPACFLAPPLGVGNSGRSPKGRRRNRSFKVRFTQDLRHVEYVISCNDYLIVQCAMQQKTLSILDLMTFFPFQFYHT